MEVTRQSERRAKAGQLSTGCYSGPVAAANDEDIAVQVKGLSALADPTRLAIIDMLSRTGEPLCVCDILARFALQQPTISHHLKVLREAGLVKWEKRGLWVHYSLNRLRVEELASYLGRVADGATSGT